MVNNKMYMRCVKCKGKIDLRGSIGNSQIGYKFLCLDCNKYYYIAFYSNSIVVYEYNNTEHIVFKRSHLKW